jgi:hypothetical protein
MENLFTNLLINLKNLRNMEPEEKISLDREKNKNWESERNSIQSTVIKIIIKGIILLKFSSQIEINYK